MTTHHVLPPGQRADDNAELRAEVVDLRRLLRLLASDLAAMRREMSTAGITPPPSKLESGWMTPTAYARARGISYNAAMMRIKRGTVEAEQDANGHWLVRNV